MRSTYKVLFYIKGNAIKSNGKAPIMARITLDGKVSQFSLKCEVNPADWNPNAGKAIGKTAQIQQLNVFLDNCKAKIYNHYREISERESVVTAEKIRNAFLGQQLNNDTLLDLFQNHIKMMKSKCENNLIGTNQVKRFERTHNRLQQYMQEKYKISDISIKEINYSFISNFEIFLKTNYGCGHNTAVKIIQHLRTVVLIAKNNGKLHVDPFVNYKFSFEKTDRGYLTENELEIIMNKHFSIKRLEQVRDVFLFSAFTGLAYIDVKSLTTDNICKSFDDNLWIIGKRIKTNVTYRVPLLDIPKIIIEKYKGNLPNGLLLPILSNQKMNAYLKEIADLCGINKKLTYHLARHSFATLILTKGVSIESVSKMLGHTNIKTTQIYAKITDTKISDDMAMLAGKLKGIETKLVINQ
ncbi:MAG: site-specific integrase [Bacteroidales bacterium]|jgi:site-specific recombinase XerD|nr:site-specific integrase [Bacteroidales bacterium]